MKTDKKPKGLLQTAAWLRSLPDKTAQGKPELPKANCRHCERQIVQVNGIWVDPQASGDDEIWREVCDSHDTFDAIHEPKTASDAPRAPIDNHAEALTRIVILTAHAEALAKALSRLVYAVDPFSESKDLESYFAFPIARARRALANWEKAK